MSIDDMTSGLIQQIQQTNELQPLSKPQPITVGGIEGRSTLLSSSSPFPDANGQPQKERLAGNGSVARWLHDLYDLRGAGGAVLSIPAGVRGNAEKRTVPLMLLNLSAGARLRV